MDPIRESKVKRIARQPLSYSDVMLDLFDASSVFQSIIYRIEMM